MDRLWIELNKRWHNLALALLSYVPYVLEISMGSSPMDGQSNKPTVNRQTKLHRLFPSFSLSLSLSLSLFSSVRVSLFHIQRVLQFHIIERKKQGNESYFWTSANGSMHKVLAGRGRSGGRVHSRNHWCISLEQRWYLNINIYNIRKNPAPPPILRRHEYVTCKVVILRGRSVREQIVGWWQQRHEETVVRTNLGGKSCTPTFMLSSHASSVSHFVA
jgi:hypothetical protein